jgi:hypothetical protein
MPSSSSWASASRNEGLFAKITLNVDGEGVRDFAVRAFENMDDLRPAWAVVTENLRALETRVFDGKGAPLGAAWKPLATSTVDDRLHKRGHYRLASSEGPSERILHWTLALRNSLTKPGAPWSIAAASASTLTFGTNVEDERGEGYAAPNQATRRFLGMPAAFVRTDVIPPIANYLRGLDPAAGQGARTTRRAPRVADGRAVA